MPKKKIQFIKLQCTQCQRVNYYKRKPKKAKKKLELRKYCRFCRKHTLHKEAK